MAHFKDVTKPPYNWFNGDFAVFRERPRTVMHNTLVVILNAKVADNCTVVLIEVMLAATLNIIPVDSNEIVPFRGTLLVIKPDGMHQLVDDYAVPQALHRTEVHNLAAIFHANTRPTATVVRLDVDPIGVALDVWPKAQAGVVVVVLHGG